MSSKSTVRSESSSVSFKRKQSQVKLQLAAYAKEVEEQKQKYYVEVENCEQAEKEAQMKKLKLKRELALKERELEEQFAEFELKAWENMSLTTVDEASISDLNNVEQLRESYLCKEVKTQALPVPVKLDYKAAITPSLPSERRKFNTVERTRQWITESIDPTSQSDIRYDNIEPKSDFNVEDKPQLQMPGTSYCKEPVILLNDVDVSLPRPTIPTFDGDPLKYGTFANSFQVHVTQKVRNKDMWLSYLLQYCTPKVRDMICHFSMTSQGFDKAWLLLYERFGQPHVIANCCERQLLLASKVRPRDRKSLRSLANLMKTAQSYSETLGGFLNLNSWYILKQIGNKMPDDMLKEWVETAHNISCRTKCQATFKDMTDFVSHKADVADSTFASLYWSDVAAPPSRSMYASKRKEISAFNTVSSSLDEGKLPDANVCSKFELKCIKCQKSHSLAHCKEFEQMDYAAKLQFARQKNLCFKCLKPGHIISRCVSNEYCMIKGCSNRNQHTLLHNYNVKGTTAANDSTKVASNVIQQQESTTCATSTIVNHDAYLAVLPVTLSSCESQICTYALLDSGSQRSFCSQSIADQLNLVGKRETVYIKTLSSKKDAKPASSMQVSFKVCAPDAGYSEVMKQVLTVDTLPLLNSSIPLMADLQEFDHLKDIEIKQLSCKEIGLIIGTDYPHLICPTESRTGAAGQPIGLKTPLGWVIIGPKRHQKVDEKSEFVGTRVMHTTVKTSCKQKSFEFEDFEPNVVPPALQNVNHSREDRISYQFMIDNVEFKNGHYQLPLLWRDQKPQLPDNRHVVDQRLKSLKLRLSKDKTLCKRYTDVMEEYIQRGEAELVENEDGFDSQVSWFLPHHPVLQAKKPSKMRIVFDCGAECDGKSLNKALMQGPDLTNKLVGMLIRFREDCIALTADIKAMYHQVRVKREDRIALKFLWWPNGRLDQDPLVHRMAVHLFGASSSPSCASFCLQQALKRLEENGEMYAFQKAVRSFYVDDFLLSVSSVLDGINLMLRIKSVLKESGFDLIKWKSNSTEVLEAVDEHDRAETCARLPDSDLVGESVLGVIWNVNSDCFKLNVNVPDKPLTRRGLLSMLSSLYDPLGFMVPVIIPPRLWQRELNERDWDDPISQEETSRWNAWLKELNKLQDLEIPRSFKSEDHDAVYFELHYFADASSVAYGVVCYLRTIDRKENIKCSFVFGKGHLAPRGLTIPKLELEAAVLAARLDKFLRMELSLKIDKSVFWSDSMATLHCIYNSKRKHPVYVAHRIVEIDNCSGKNDWNYVPTAENPADDVTRGQSVKQLLKSKRWLR